MCDSRSNVVVTLRPRPCSSCRSQGSNDPQTEADRRAQKCIVTTLEARFPGLRIVGEEVRRQFSLSCCLSVECTTCSLQDITLSDDDRKLAAEGECAEVLKEQCPAEYSSVDLEDVSDRVGGEGLAAR